MAIPRSVEEEVIRLALAKVEKEDASRQELLKGGYLRDVFAKHGVL